MYTISDDLIKKISNFPFDYEGYIELGDYLFKANINQAYLCYENALFWCDDKCDGRIKDKLEKAISAGVIISRQGIRIGTLFRSIDFLLRTTGSQVRST